MDIGTYEKENTMEEALHFDKDNIFEYLFYILTHQNANWFGTESEDTLEKLNTLLEQTPQLDNKRLDIEDLINHALVQTSQYAYESGFKEACRLNKTLNSF